MKTTAIIPIDVERREVIFARRRDAILAQLGLDGWMVSFDPVCQMNIEAMRTDNISPAHALSAIECQAAKHPELRKVAR